MNEDYIIDYIRLVSYILVILVSFFQYKYKRFVSKYILFGNMILAGTMAFSLLYFHLFQNATSMMGVAAFLTPATVIWALLNFVSFMKI